MEFFEKRIRTQFEAPLKELKGLSKGLKEHVSKAKGVQLSTGQLLREVERASAEMRALLADLQTQATAQRTVKAGKVETALDEGLAKVCSAANLKILDVGGRSGPLEFLAPFAPYATLFSCEPEPEAGRQLVEQLKEGGWREAAVLKEALGEKEGEVRLNVLRQPGLTSLLEPDPKIFGRFYEPSLCEVVRHETVPSIRLDTAAEKYGFTDLAVLKLDTQGSELEILRSGPKVLSQLVAVYVETENLSFYKNQPRFADVDSFLTEAGFTLFDLKRTFLRRDPKVKVPYSRRELGWFHGLYVRLPAGRLDELSFAEAHRLFAVALLLEYFDLAADVLGVSAFRKELQNRFETDTSWEKQLYRQSMKLLERLAKFVPEEQRPLLQGATYTDRKFER